MGNIVCDALIPSFCSIPIQIPYIWSSASNILHVQKQNCLCWSLTFLIQKRALKLILQALRLPLQLSFSTFFCLFGVFFVWVFFFYSVKEIVINLCYLSGTCTCNDPVSCAILFKISTELLNFLFTELLILIFGVMSTSFISPIKCIVFPYHNVSVLRIHLFHIGLTTLYHSWALVSIFSHHGFLAGSVCNKKSTAVLIFFCLS